MDYEKAWATLKERAIVRRHDPLIAMSGRAELEWIVNFMRDLEAGFPNIETFYSIPKGTIMIGHWQEKNGKLEFKELGRIENVKVDE